MRRGLTIPPCRAPVRGPASGRGFTLVELMVTVAILAVLAMLAAPLAEVAARRGKEQELRLALRQIRTALDAYKQAFDEGKIEKQVGDSGYPPNLDVLAQGVVDITSPNGDAKLFFLRRLPRDPLHPEVNATAAETWGKRSYASPPDEPQEGRDVYDVYSLSKDVGLNGIPYREW